MNVYLVTNARNRGFFTYNKRTARRIAKKHDARVFTMPRSLFNCCSAWDVPTFIVQADEMPLGATR